MDNRSLMWGAILTVSGLALFGGGTGCQQEEQPYERVVHVDQDRDYDRPTTDTVDRDDPPVDDWEGAIYCPVPLQCLNGSPWATIQVLDASPRIITGSVECTCEEPNFVPPGHRLGSEECKEVEGDTQVMAPLVEGSQTLIDTAQSWCVGLITSPLPG